MNITITKEGDISILSLTGSLDTNTSKGAENEMNKLIEEGRTKLLIDLSNLDFGKWKLFCFFYSCYGSWVIVWRK